jgi:hypothetical protein
MTLNKFIEFREVAITKNRITKKYEVVSKLHGDLLGVISWYSRWRQYAFYPESNTLFNTDCLTTIKNFLTLLMEQRKRHATD